MKKLIITAILGIFFAAVMSIAASATGTGTEADPWLIGTPNEGDVTAVLSGTGANLTLTISGTGAMADVIGGASWYSQRDSIKTIVVESGVTSIGDYAFYPCSKVTSVSLPDTVTSIGYEAFSGCSSLTSITLPDSVTSIGKAAFFNCDALTSINIPEGVTSIAKETFVSCENLSSVTIPDSVTSIGNHAFDNCASLTTVIYGGTPTEWATISKDQPVIKDIVPTYSMAVSTTVTLTPATAEYDGTDHKPAVDAITVKKGNTPLVYDRDYTVSYSADKFIDPGTYTITITGKGDYSGTCTAEFKVTGIKITTTVLPIGVVNNAYSQTLTCTGGTGAKTWEVIESSLPAGLTLDEQKGLITGTPTTPGTYTFNVKVTDSETKRDIKQLTITITLQKYDIIILDDGNGSVYASETWATAGTLIKLTVIPKPGFALRSLDHTYKDIIMNDGTFIMPAHDVILSAVFETTYNVQPVPKPDPEILPASGVAIPLNFRATSTQNGNTARLRWSNFPYADKFTVFMTVDGVQTKLKDTKNNSLTVKGLKNGVTYRFMVTFTVGTWTSPESLAATATVTPYFKPLVNAKRSDGNIRLGWKGVPDAEGYIVSKLVDGKLKQIAETTGTSALITNATSGKEYVFAVSAIINGEKTGVKKSDLVTVKL